MVRIPEILNHSDDSSEESGSMSSTTPSSMSLGASSSNMGSRASISSGSTSTSASYDKLPIKRFKTEPKEGLADEIKHNIESDLPKRYKYVPSADMAGNGVEESDEINHHPAETERSSPDSDNGDSHPSHRLKFHLPQTLPVSRINKRLLTKKLVQIAIRRKSVSQLKDPVTSLPITHTNSKLHTKSLEAGLRVKLTLAPDLYSLYNSLTPHTNRKHQLMVYNSNVPGEYQNMILANDNYSNDVHLESKTVQLIDNNLVNISGFSNKVLKAFKSTPDGTGGKANETILPTFNSLDTAVHSLFGINEYSLVRITRSTTTDQDGSILLKFETAKPGELNLIDDDEFTDDLLHSIGKSNDVPSNIFIKKVLARPRYKSDMKIYLIPKNINSSLYVDKRMFERDLINGVIDVNLPFYKNIYCTFEFHQIVAEFLELLELSKRANHQDHRHNSQLQNRSISTTVPPNYLPIQHLKAMPPVAAGLTPSPGTEVTSPGFNQAYPGSPNSSMRFHLPPLHSPTSLPPISTFPGSSGINPAPSGATSPPQLRSRSSSVTKLAPLVSRNPKPPL